MIKKYLKILIVTSILILLPMIFGVAVWNQLPESMPVHWNISGEADGWGSRLFVVVGLPVCMVAIQWVALLATSADPRRAALSDKVLHLVLWIIPALTLLLQAITYATALGKEIRVDVIMSAFMGILFVVIGNYLPKCKRTYTLGIRIPWTLNSDENWNMTHRLAGWVWTIGGIVMIPLAFLGGFVANLAVAMVVAIVPTIYSYILYKKGI